MPGVNFTRQSANRIADTVRGFEGQASPDNKLQRKRAGGLGRLTLWEVTAVQTGPKTVTIKRVDNIDFDLNDPSEKENILYDPANEPSVGDRGLLIRLGEGVLFFFRRGAGQVVTNYVSGTALVKSDAPNTNFGHNTTPLTIHQDHTGIQHHVVYKWTKVVQITDYLALTRKLMSVGTGAVPYAKMAYQTGDTTPENVNVDFNIFAIKEDFDPSTITWNILAGLSTVPILSGGTAAFTLTGNKISSGIGGALLRGEPGSWNGIVRPPGESEDFPMYGIYLEIVTGSNHSSWTTNLTLASGVGGPTPVAWFTAIDPSSLF